MSHSGKTLLLLLSLATTHAAANDSPLVVAARQRQERYKTFELEWTRKDFLRKGSVSDQLSKSFGLKTAIPDRDTTVESTNSLIVDGTKIRYINAHPSWLVPDGILQYPKAINTFDGNEAVSHYPLGISGKYNSLGIIHGENTNASIREISLIPLAAHYRGLLSLFTDRRLEQFKPTGNAIEIDKVRCEEYRSGQSKQQWVYWVDPAAQQVIRRMQFLQEGRIGEHLEIRYHQDDQGDLHPSSWTWNRYSEKGVTREANTFEVISRKVNTNQPATLFVANLPVGTTVEDQRRHKLYRLDPGGGKTEVTPRGEVIGPLMAEGSWFWRNKWFLLAASLVSLWLVVWIVRRKKSLG